MGAEQKPLQVRQRDVDPGKETVRRVILLGDGRRRVLKAVLFQAPITVPAVGENVAAGPDLAGLIAPRTAARRQTMHGTGARSSSSHESCGTLFSCRSIYRLMFAGARLIFVFRNCSRPKAGTQAAFSSPGSPAMPRRRPLRHWGGSKSHPARPSKSLRVFRTCSGSLYFPRLRLRALQARSSEGIERSARKFIPCFPGVFRERTRRFACGQPAREGNLQPTRRLALRMPESSAGVPFFSGRRI
jgi:hypothetical protein